MNHLSVFKYLFFITLFLLSALENTFAHKVKYVTHLDRVDQEVAAILLVEDPLINDDPGTAGLEKFVATRYATVGLIYGRESLTDLRNDYWSYRVSYDLFATGQSTPFGQGVLTINHADNNSVYEQLQKYEAISGKINIVVTLVEASDDDFQTIITDPALIDAMIPEDIRLELNLEIERIDYLDHTLRPTINGNYDFANHNLKLRWSFMSGAESYEIEWAYIDDRIDPNARPTTIEEIFAKAVRVEVVGQSYEVSVTYPHGDLYYRIRAVGRFIRGNLMGDYSHLKYSVWSKEDVFSIDAFETQLNWQYTTTFAEEGKHKKVITYFDDGLKNRQTQTNLSTDDISLVATAHYDVEGRPTVNVLPVPALGSDDLFYKPRFNRNTDGATYNRLNFDKSSNYCDPELPDPLSDFASPPGAGQITWGGAAHYFSPEHSSNDNGTGIYKDFLPDAEDYPMTQVKYLNDGTGRIASQSGVGRFYQLGNGQETNYFYDDPSSTQLVRLFGNNVGDSKYYKRNIVQDANGQLSISYLDAAGRVIATALSGNVPQNVQELGSYTTAEGGITENFMENNEVYKEDGLSVTRTTLMNEAENTKADFTYKMTPQAEAVALLDGTGSQCIGCEYRLTIRVHDPCGAPVPLNFSVQDLGILKDGEFIYQWEAVEDCDKSQAELVFDFNILMEKIGLYKIEKELRVVDPSLDYLQTRYTILRPPAPEMDSLSCRVTCFECLPSTAKGSGASSTAGSSCLNPIDSCIVDPFPILADAVSQDCKTLLYQMINQVSPGGCQFNSDPSWWAGKINDLEFELLNETTGIVEMVMGTNTTLTNLLSSSSSVWRDQWNEQLATVHPAYCHYILCRDSEASRLFDLNLSSANTWRDLDTTNTALPDTNLISIANLGLLLSVDPMMNSGIGFYPNYWNNPDLSNSEKLDIKLSLIYNLNIANAQDPISIADALKVKLLVNFDNYGFTGTGFIGVVDYINGNDIFDIDDDLNFDGNIDILDTQIGHFQLLKHIYIAEKNRLLTAIRDDKVEISPDPPVVDGWCTDPFGPCQIVKDHKFYEVPKPTSNPPDSTIDAMNEINDTELEKYKLELCATRLDEWMSTIENDIDCNISDPQILQTVGMALSGYCTSNFGMDNPLGLLVVGSMGQAGFPSDLDGIAGNNNVEGILGSQCWDAFIAKHMVQFDDVYKNIIIDDSNHNNIIYLEVEVDGVMVTVATPKQDEESVDFDAYYNYCMGLQALELLYEWEILYQKVIEENLSHVLNELDCLDGVNEDFYAKYAAKEHHYTLYYYDQSGNLVQTVPPIGARPLTEGDFLENGIRKYPTKNPAHEQVTRYQYNTLGQVIAQKSPDGGRTDFKYDYAQRLRVSQNEKQAPENPLSQSEKQEYSFTKYDAQGRIVEVGEMTNVNSANSFASIKEKDLNDFNFPSTSNGSFTDVVTTEYNKSLSPDPDFTQENLRGRVAVSTNDHQTTRYSYDEHGNVKALQHKMASLYNFSALVEYDYDLISGNVKEVAYQPGKIDEFYHRYEYDADNRLTYVYTSPDANLWEQDARYFYYQHGPLARVEIGEDNVQGMDYYYTLQGWIKGVNLTGVGSTNNEPGKDGVFGYGRNQYIAKDEMAYTLGYHYNDYRAIGSAGNQDLLDSRMWNQFSSNLLPFSGSVNEKGLFNGNIAWMVTDVSQFDQANGSAGTLPEFAGLRAMVYQYDQLHRIKNAHSYRTVENGSPPDGPSDVYWEYDKQFDTNYGYDANGNLQTLQRNTADNNNVGLLDDLLYVYKSDHPNQLDQVRESSGFSIPDDNSVQAGQANGNYKYDKIGNLISDAQEEISEIIWNVFGKVEEIRFDDGRMIKFTYDPAGNRLSKSTYASKDTPIDEVYYIRDASGNVLSVYDKDDTGIVLQISQKEVSLYGSSRLGVQKFFDREVVAGNPPTSNTTDYIRLRGRKYYEGSNHLGNVLAVVSDQKELVGVKENGVIVDRYRAKVVSANDYYPFGLAMRGRSYDSPQYRYGFNGKEKDESGEFGSLTTYDYGFRIYNPGIARFLSVDPLTKSYPWYTPYQFSANSPIRNIDLDGLEADSKIEGRIKQLTEEKLKITTAGRVNIMVLPDDIMRGSGPAAVGADSNNDGFDDALDYMSQSAQKADRVLTLYVSGVDELAENLRDIRGSGKKIGNLIFEGHGGQSTPGFFIGGDQITARNGKINELKKLSPFLDEGSACVIKACNTGGGRNPDFAANFVQRSANRLKVPVIASMSWTRASADFFNTEKWFFQEGDPASYIYNDVDDYDPTYSRRDKQSLLNMGAWIKVIPMLNDKGNPVRGMSIDTLGTLRFYPDGTFQSDDDLPFEGNEEFVEELEKEKDGSN